ncbi:MAG: 30S ribosomal protein S8 [Candidatus Kapabacteria bacterium]|jgi:small subunit ribosomal protein S8|nr:30S ribosomal protein S8 [Ignavibacteria bacterium]MBP6509046.1 30S ribosomal protein S8 [Candidatus Kapabacteria bacterium]HLP27398.1 30S ribosomal protein S8 [Candidatus Didemnitutus sp.]MBK6419389.1 30S ribosomal protein S8 [Ignavibacteria bacterium]MBK6759980.1 30S ribosomal protein S8 [Ignavibacteria bacterium]
MPVTDTIADFITRIRNASAAKHKTVDVPASKLKVAIAEILKDQGFILDFESVEDNKQGVLTLKLRYHYGQPVIREVHRVSKPGRRIYAPADKLPRVRNGLGVAIISTPRGVMTDKQARRENVGGEVLCTIW